MGDAPPYGPYEHTIGAICEQPRRITVWPLYEEAKRALTAAGVATVPAFERSPAFQASINVEVAPSTDAERLAGRAVVVGAGAVVVVDVDAVELGVTGARSVVGEVAGGFVVALAVTRPAELQPAASRDDEHTTAARRPAAR